MKKGVEINYGYVNYLRAMNQLDVAASSLRSVPRLSRVRFTFWQRFRQGTTLAGLLAITLFLQVWLRLSLLFKSRKVPALNVAAMNNVDSFVEQYPFHLYPIVCKAFELAYLRAQLPKVMGDNARIVEIAIGDGTLSERLFSSKTKVMALDLSPYSLKKASQKSHVAAAIVCDCLNPPIGDGAFDLLIANNFLHHVTNKAETLSNWSRIAPTALFNENSPTWASGWPVPYILRKLGQREKASVAATQIEQLSLQSLEPKSQLDSQVAQYYDIKECESYMSERTFFFCGLFSYVMRCYGPPTPTLVKGLFLKKPFRWLVLPLTANVAKLLIRYDQHQDRSSDAFISYLGASKHYPTPAVAQFVCADCREPLPPSNTCSACGRQYSLTDGMLFLLPRALADLQEQYNSEVSATTPREHL